MRIVIRALTVLLLVGFLTGGAGFVVPESTLPGTVDESYAASGMAAMRGINNGEKGTWFLVIIDDQVVASWFSPDGELSPVQIVTVELDGVAVCVAAKITGVIDAPYNCHPGGNGP